MSNAAEVAERATTDMLIGPDWGINIELCDIINRDPGQAEDALKILQKNLWNKNPQVQLLTLVVLETLTKNCSVNIFQQIAELDILHDMVKLVKQKPDLSVREKILTLIDTWQDALGGRRGRFPGYYDAYMDLLSYGIVFPPREENRVPLFISPQTNRIPSDSSRFPEHAITNEASSLDSDTSGLSLPEIQNAEGLADVLMEMLAALDPTNPEGVKDEIIVDLVDQCRSYQKRVVILVNNTADEDSLCRGLALNDTLQRVIALHDDIAKGKRASSAPITLRKVNLDKDDESEDEFVQLARRSLNKTEISRLPPPPPPSGAPHSSNVDYLSGGVYATEQYPTRQGLKQEETPASYDQPIHSSLSQDDMINPTAWMFGSKQEKDEDFEHRYAEEGNGSGSSSLGLGDLSIKTSLESKKKNQNPEDSLFKDLVDLAKTKSSSPKPPDRFF